MSRMGSQGRQSPPRAAAFLGKKAKIFDAAAGKACRRVMIQADDEAIHDMRVAIRRLRTLLRFARPVFGRHRASLVRSAFTAVQATTGELRDEEALADTLGSLPVLDPAFVAWRTRRRARDKKLRADAITRLRAGDLARARRLLSALLLFPVRPSRDPELGRFARRTVQRARKRVEALRDVPTSDVEGMHELRILYKELRYSAEIFAEVLPIDLAALAAPAARFQKRLGDLHDIDVALEAIAHARGLPQETRANVAAALVEVRARKAKKYLEDMAPAIAEDPVGPLPARELPSVRDAKRPLIGPLPSPPELPPREVYAEGVVALRKISTL